MNYYLVSPLYEGDISIESTFENGRVTELVYELDEMWNGDKLICGTDEFICEKSLADELAENNITGFSVSDMTVIYDGSAAIPEFKRMSITGCIDIKSGTYKNATADICITKNVGELAISERALRIIGMVPTKTLVPYKKEKQYTLYLKTPLTYEEITENLSDGLTVSSEGDIYKISGSSKNKVLLFISCINSKDALVGKSENELLEWELFFSNMI